MLPINLVYYEAYLLITNS